MLLLCLLWLCYGTFTSLRHSEAFWVPFFGSSITSLNVLVDGWDAEPTPNCWCVLGEKWYVCTLRYTPRNIRTLGPLLFLRRVQDYRTPSRSGVKRGSGSCVSRASPGSIYSGNTVTSSFPESVNLAWALFVYQSRFQTDPRRWEKDSLRVQLERERTRSPATPVPGANLFHGAEMKNKIK